MGSGGFARESRKVWGTCGAAVTPSRRAIWAASLAVTGLLLNGCRCEDKPGGGAGESPAAVAPRQQPPVVEPPAPLPAPAPPAQTEPALEPGREISLFDGQSLGQWKVTDFGGQGEVHVKDGAIYLEMGSYATGITWAGPVVRMNYEITLDAMRVQGSDFFCGLTFPVADKPCTLILGGWGGGLCGLSSIDYFDASENETTRILRFENGKWYHVRLRVVPNRIQAWLDDESLVDVDITGRKIDIRLEMDLCQPLGIATWVTTGAIRNIRLKKLPDEAP
jgi:hypothetical protein